MINLHQHLPTNSVGRDFIVGDLHGCLDLFQAELKRIAFNPDRDRILSVGDLADRGLDSMGCLRLLREPWFHAVRGNHEQMLINFSDPDIIPYGTNTEADLFFRNGGGWVRNLPKDETDELWSDLLRRVVQLPYVITVGEGGNRFHVAHAELMTGNPHVSFSGLRRPEPGNRLPSDQILTDDELTESTLDAMTTALIWGRRVVGSSKPNQSMPVDTPAGRLLISRKPWHPGLSLTYVGHTPLNQMRLHASHLFIDRGAFMRKRDSCLLVLCHDKVLTWLPASSESLIH
ncbi:metallophosphoesterase [Alcaligenaceae bacterium CGII-47]|nr:metallophosphoesterase [Alcaligenaceae bacterium CGII-47]